MTVEVPILAEKAQFDAAIADAGTYADDATYHAIFAELRSEAPLYWTEPEGYRPFWTVSKYADIQAIELKANIFLNEPRLNLAPIEAEEQAKAFTGGRHLTYNLVSMDNPDHRHFRAMTQAWFAPKSLKQLEDEIRALARESVDEMDRLGNECDFVRQIALWFPLRIIMRTLGAPREDEEFLMKITQEVFGAEDPDTPRSGTLEALFQTLAEFGAWCNAITEDRRLNPREDVATVIANATMPDGSPVGAMEAMSYYLIIATAGHDTTSSSISRGLLELIRNPAEMEKLRADPSLLPNAVDEFIRYGSPVKHFFRTAAVDTEVNGQAIRAGQSLMMCYPSANRDEDIFKDPGSFRIDRPDAKKHLAFGYGPHVCLGQHLAKLEIRILFEELLERFTDFELAGEPQNTKASFVSGLKTLPIRYRRR